MSDQAWTAAGIAALSLNLAVLWALEGVRLVGTRSGPGQGRPLKRTHFVFLLLACLGLVWMWDEPRVWVRWILEGFVVLSLAGFAFGTVHRRREVTRD